LARVGHGPWPITIRCRQSLWQRVKTVDIYVTIEQPNWIDTSHNSGRISVNMHNKIGTMSCTDRLVYTVAILYIYSRDNNTDDRTIVSGCIIFREGVSHSLQRRRNIVYLSQILFRSQVRNNLYASIKHMLQRFFPRYLSAQLKLCVY